MSSLKPQTQTESNIDLLVEGLVQKVTTLPEGARYIIGVTGSPGAGKSTVSEWMVHGVNQRLPNQPAIIVPMDGFHYSNEKLTELNLLHLKGIPDTFDAASFVDLLRRLRTTTHENVYCPVFDRSIEASIENAIVVEPKHKVCVVEGNYLLLERQPWDQCRNYLDEAWFLDVQIATILPRLYERHILGGRAPEAAKAKVESTDLPNAILVEATRKFADKLIKLPEMPVSG